MDGFIVIVFFMVVFIIISQSKKKKPVQKKGRRLAPKTAMSHEQEWSARLQKAKTAQRSMISGQSTLQRYKQVQRQRYKQQMKANSGLWQSKHRVDNNRKRRSDWGARGDKALLSPAMIGIIGGGVLTIYLGLSALYG